MATEITEAGYQTLRDYIEANWKYIELRDDLNAAVTRVDITTDERFAWTHTGGDQELVIEGIVKGEDADIGVGTTIEGSALYAVSEGGDELHHDTDTAFTFGAEADELNITHTIQVPEVTE